MKLLALLLCVAACGDKKPAPQPDHEREAEQEDAVTIRVAADGSVAIMGVPARPADVEPALMAVSRELGEQGCILDVDATVPYATTLGIVDQCRSAGVDRVSINGVAIRLPEPAANEITERTTFLVEMQKDGSVLLAGRPVPDAELDERLGELTRRPDTDVVIHPDESVATGRVVDAWKRALIAGVPAIEIVRVQPHRGELPQKHPVTEQ